MAESSAELDDTDKEIVEFIESRPGSFVGTPEVADKLDLTTNGAAYRLKKLRSRDILDSRKPSRDEIWYLNQEASKVADTERVTTAPSFSGPIQQVGSAIMYAVVALIVLGALVRMGFGGVDVALSFVLFAGMMLLGWALGGRIERIRGWVE